MLFGSHDALSSVASVRLQQQYTAWVAVSEERGIGEILQYVRQMEGVAPSHPHTMGMLDVAIMTR